MTRKTHLLKTLYRQGVKFYDLEEQCNRIVGFIFISPISMEKPFFLKKTNWERNSRNQNNNNIFNVGLTLVHSYAISFFLLHCLFKSISVPWGSPWSLGCYNRLVGLAVSFAHTNGASCVRMNEQSWSRNFKEADFLFLF